MYHIPSTSAPRKRDVLFVAPRCLLEHDQSTHLSSLLLSLSHTHTLSLSLSLSLFLPLSISLSLDDSEGVGFGLYTWIALNSIGSLLLLLFLYYAQA